MAATLAMTNEPDTLHAALVRFVNVAARSLQLQAQAATHGSAPPSTTLALVSFREEQVVSADQHRKDAVERVEAAEREFFEALGRFQGSIKQKALEADVWCERQNTLRSAAEQYVLATVRHACAIHNLAEVQIKSVEMAYTCPPVECDGPSVATPRARGRQKPAAAMHDTGEK